MSKYILPKGVEIKEIQQTMYTGGRYAYPEKGMAEFETAIGQICECGKEYKYDGVRYTCCPKCREKHDTERYLKFELVGWDGETPLVIHDSDTYFFNRDEIDYHCEEFGVNINDLQLVVCKPNSPSYLYLNDYLEDILPEDADAMELSSNLYSAEEIETIVNDWLKAVSPISWSAGNKRVTLEENKNGK